jgi:hypothetical protein
MLESQPVFLLLACRVVGSDGQPIICVGVLLVGFRHHSLVQSLFKILWASSMRYLKARSPSLLRTSCPFTRKQLLESEFLTGSEHSLNQLTFFRLVRKLAKATSNGESSTALEVLVSGKGKENVPPSLGLDPDAGRSKVPFVC